MRGSSPGTDSQSAFLRIRRGDDILGGVLPEYCHHILSASRLQVEELFGESADLGLV